MLPQVLLLKMRGAHAAAAAMQLLRARAEGGVSSGTAAVALSMYMQHAIPLQPLQGLS